MKGVFITGTDTGVGKTTVATLLCRLLSCHGFDLAVRKPVESGCTLKDGELFPNDAYSLQQAAQSLDPLSLICPYRFAAPLSPARAANLEKKPLKLDQLIEASKVDRSSFLIVEGAGGFYSPIAQDGLNADLAEKLGLPILIVAGNRLGAINQVLLVLEALQRRGLTPLGIVLNQIQPISNPKLQNREELQDWTQLPILEIPFCNPKNAHTINDFLNPILAWIDQWEGLPPLKLL